MTSEQEKKNREELFKIMLENPDLPVVPMVASEIVGDDGYSYWMGSWGICKVGEYFRGEESVHFREDDDWDDIERALLDDTYSDYVIDSMDEKTMKEVYAGLPWIKAIIVYIELPE